MLYLSLFLLLILIKTSQQHLIKLIEWSCSKIWFTQSWWCTSKCFI